LSAGNVNVVQYKGPDVIERPENAFAARRAYIHPDRLKNKLAHGMQTPANPLGFPRALRSKERSTFLRTALMCRLDKKSRRWVRTATALVLFLVSVTTRTSPAMLHMHS
jgi:hypothetical protein